MAVQTQYNRKFFNLFKNNSHAVETNMTKDKDEWLNYDESKCYTHFFDSPATLGPNNSICMEKNYFTFVNKDFTDPNCTIALHKKYNSGNLYCVEVLSIDDCKPVRIDCDDFSIEELLKNDDYKNAVILSIHNKDYLNESVYYFIVSPAEAALYKAYKEHPTSYFINDEKVTCSEYNIQQANSIRASDSSSMLKTHGLDVIKFTEEDNLSKKAYTYYGVSKKSLNEKCIQVERFSAKFKLLSYFYYPVIGNYFLKSDWESMVEELKQYHEPYVIKGSNKPPYFKIKDFITESDTTNWYEFILKNYFDNKVEDWMLETLKK